MNAARLSATFKHFAGIRDVGVKLPDYILDKNMFRPYSYGVSNKTNDDAQNAAAKATYMPLFDRAIADLKTPGYLTLDTIAHLEVARSGVPLGEIHRLDNPAGEQTNRPYLRTYHQRFVNAVCPLLDSIKATLTEDQKVKLAAKVNAFRAPSPASAPGHHPAGM